MNRMLKTILLGVLLAALFWAAKGPPGQEEDLPQIIVSAADVAHQQSRWEKMRGRPPTDTELKNAVDAYVRNEVLYLEALRTGMDRQDPRVRLALIQKMQMLLAGQADAQTFSEQNLEAFYALRKEKYKTPARMSVKQVFFKTEAAAKQQATALLKQFNESEPSDERLHEAGDATLLESTVLAVTALDLEKQFGTDFTAAVLSQPSNDWNGPIRSGFGWHIVNVFDRIPARQPGLSEVREKVESDLRYQTREAFEEQGFQEIASRYQVVISDDAEQMLSGDTK